MKSCPACSRTYPDDTLAFCLVDGSVLSAPYQSEERPAGRSVPTTEVMGPATNAGVPGPRAQSTIVAPPPPLPQLRSRQPVEEAESKRSLAPWLVAGGAIILALTLGLVLIVIKLSDDQAKRPEPKISPTPTPRIKSACGTTLGPVLFEKWTELGGEAGRMGCPISSETDAPVSPKGTKGRWVRFGSGDGGYVIWHETGAYEGKAFEVSGCVFKLYSSLGGTKSWLGFPVTDGRDTTTGARQDFEDGYVLWDRKTYACEAHKF